MDIASRVANISDEAHTDLCMILAVQSLPLSVSIARMDVVINFCL